MNAAFGFHNFRRLGRKPKRGKDPKFLPNISPISLSSTTGKLFEKVVLKIVHRYIKETGLFNASQFGFRARHSTTLQCTRLTDHVTLNFNNNMSTAAVFLDIEKAFDTTRHPGMLYKLSKPEFLAILIKRISSFLSQRKLKSVDRRRNVYAKVNASRGASSFRHVPNTVQYVYKWYSHTPCVYLALFANDSCMYATDRKEGYILRKLQRGLNSIETRFKHWNIKIDENKTRVVCFSHRRRPPEALWITFNIRVTRSFHIESSEAKAFRTFIRVYSLFRIKRLSPNIKLTLP
jgi:hypothetical protein